MGYGLGDFQLTDEQKDWFANRMDESSTGRVLVPSHLYKKFKKLADNDFLNNENIKCYLIDHCYNRK